VPKKPAPKKRPVVPKNGPLSETLIEKLKDGTMEQVVEDLRRLVLAEPEKVISRNYYRVHGLYHESVWNQHFGTFDEFKRQAGIVLTRQQHKLEKEIAIHASRDHYRQVAAERLGYEGKYLRPTKGRYKTIVVGSDLHDKECDPFWLRVFIDTVRRIQPDVTCLNGDIFDLPEFGKYTVDPRSWDVVGRIKAVHENILKPLREVAPNSQLDLLEGNHEARMLRMLADETPALKVLLSDLHGWTIPRLLGLDAYEVNYIARADLAAVSKHDFDKELAKNYKIYFDCFLANHFPAARSNGMPGWNGHHHRHNVWEFHNKNYGTYEWHQLGAGHVRSAEYCDGERWANGLLIAHCDTVTKATNMEYVQVTDFAVVGGKFYTRTKEEGSGNPAIWPGR
jgi:hypothetical protein